MGITQVSDDLEYKGYKGSVEYSGEDRLLFGKVLFIDSLLMYHGESVQELELAFKETLDNYLCHCEKTGKEPNKPYSGTFNVRIGQELHRQAALVAYKTGIKLNEFVLRAVKQAVEMSGCIQINHHHEHEVKVTLQNSDETVALEVSASGAKPPQDWQQLGTRH